MTPMREDEGGDPDSRAASELLRQVSATPPEPDMKRRVWAALSRTETRGVVVPHFLRLPMVVSAMAILLVAGTAGAVIARRFIGPMFHRAPAAGPAQAPAPAAAQSKTVAHRVAEPPIVAIAEPAVDLGVVETTPALRQSHGTRRSAAAATERSDRAERTDHSDRSVRALESPAATPSPRERAEVLDAMVALRRDHDATRAGQLLDRYLAARPHGALREEALALAIEAADARGDKANVSKWARNYQDAYPSGRFAAFARSHLTTAP